MIRSFPSYLKENKRKIEEVAKEYGLDFFPTVFELVDWDGMSSVGAYTGYPSRYHHWRFGMIFDRLFKESYHGLSKYYELVINNNPCYAYLLDSNPLVVQQMVMAHVYAHNDFFKNNIYFSCTNRKMLDEISNHATKISNYINRFGLERVEKFIDICLSIENLIDPFSLFFKREGSKPKKWHLNNVGKIEVPEYLDPFVNPKELLEEQRRKRLKLTKRKMRNPPYPMRDVLLFLINNAPLKRWQKDILSIIREESYYFLPQAQTKIMNEGWASFWHHKILTGSDRQNKYRNKAPFPIVGDKDIIDFCDVHSSISSSGISLNPYWLGLQIWRDIEERWNKGMFGKEWDECDDFKEKINWDKKLGLGRKKIFEVRKFYNDVNFIDEFLTKELLVKLELFSYGFNRANEVWYVDSKKYEDIKKKLLFNLSNFGRPVIRVEDGNYLNKGILLLKQEKNRFNFTLDEKTCLDVMRRIQKLWTRPVYLLTYDSNGDRYGYSIDEKSVEIKEKWWEDNNEEEVTEDEFDDLYEEEI